MRRVWSAYLNKRCKSKRDSSNKFEFKDVPQGDFYILAFIIGNEDKGGASNTLGGAVMKKISVKPNEKIEVNL